MEMLLKVFLLVFLIFYKFIRVGKILNKGEVKVLEGVFEGLLKDKDIEEVEKK